MKRTRRRKDIDRQLRLLGQSAILEEAKTPYLIRLTMLVICLVVLAFVAWASVSRVKEVARTVGEIVPTQHVQVVQHLEGGIVAEIAVAEGQAVERGQVLLRIDGERVEAEHERVSTRQRILKERRTRLLAYLDSLDLQSQEASARPVDMPAGQQQLLAGMLEAHVLEKSIITEQIEQKREQIKILRQEQATERKNLEIASASFKTQERLYQERLVPEYVYLNALQEKNARQGRLATLEIEIDQAEQALREFEARYSALSGSAREKNLLELDLVESEIAENQSTLERLAKQAERLAIRAPVDGIVKGLEVYTIGGVIAPGQPLMEIVPLEENLVAEVRIQPTDRGHIQVGDPVNVKITAYDFSRYGSIDGEVHAISATTFVEQQGVPYYKGRIRLDKQYVGEVEGVNKVLPGMIVNADIITGDKSILAYLLKPIHLSIQAGFGER